MYPFCYNLSKILAIKKKRKISWKSSHNYSSFFTFLLKFLHKNTELWFHLTIILFLPTFLQFVKKGHRWHCHSESDIDSTCAVSHIRIIKSHILNMCFSAIMDFAPLWTILDIRDRADLQLMYPFLSKQ